jgi:ABC-2 type transport system permease protein
VARLRDLVRWEWGPARRQGSPWLVAGVLLVAVAAGVVSGAAWAWRERALAAELLAQDEARWAALERELARAERGEVTPDRGGHPGAPAWLGRVGRHAMLPPTALAGLSVGELARRPSQVQVTVDSLGALLSADATEPAALLVGGGFDLGFVVVAVLPLLLLAVTYDVVSAERERGTWALILAQPVNPSHLVLAKIAVRAGVVVGTGVGGTVLGLGLTGTDLTDGNILGRLLGWAVSVALYSAFWCAVALVVNAWNWSSATNAVACLAVWLGVVVVVPSGIQTAAQLAYPMPARAELVVAVREAASRLEPDAREILARHDARYPELRPVGGRRVPDRTALQYAVLQEQEQRLSPLLAQFEAQRARREGLVTWLRPLSPALVVQGIIDDIAGSGPSRYRDFLQAIARYHDEWRAFFLGRVYRGDAVTVRDYAQIPRFAFVEDPRDIWWHPVVARQLGLVVAVAIMGLVAVWRLRRSPW